MKKTILYICVALVLALLNGCANLPPNVDEQGNALLVITDQYHIFTGYVDEITFDSDTTWSSGYLQLIGDIYESGVVPKIRVRFEDGVARSEIQPFDLVVGERITVFHTPKGEFLNATRNIPVGVIPSLHQPPDSLFVQVLIEYPDYADTAMEFIYEDNDHRYYLSSVSSHLIMLTFEDGQRVSLSEALSQQKITIADLRLNGLAGLHITPITEE